MTKNDRKNEIDEVVKVYFDIFEDDLGFCSLYVEKTDEEAMKRLEMNFKYFKAGFLFANMDKK